MLERILDPEVHINFVTCHGLGASLACLNLEDLEFGTVVYYLGLLGYIKDKALLFF